MVNKRYNDNQAIYRPADYSGVQAVTDWDNGNTQAETFVNGSPRHSSATSSPHKDKPRIPLREVFINTRIIKPNNN